MVQVLAGNKNREGSRFFFLNQLKMRKFLVRLRLTVKLPFNHPLKICEESTVKSSVFRHENSGKNVMFKTLGRLGDDGDGCRAWLKFSCHFRSP
jgi:hypothetical protein